MNFDTPYLTKQIIAYIGNKRKLLSLIYKAIDESGLKIKKGLKFGDFFAGSGVVSRFAKYLGFEVYCNDWEEYSRILAEGFIKTNKKDILELFGSQEKFNDFLSEFDNLPNPNDEDLYIAKYYAPKSEDISKADYKVERLFYTKKNALIIDKIRNKIENDYNGNDKIKNLLIAILLYQAATHTNTSGVFKAFHKEFGGHGKDALKRILSNITMEEPILIDSDYPVHVYNEDANILSKKLPELDVVYLDPPYNQHQYGSNYHMLNSIAKWDKLPEPLSLTEKGVLKNKAGIRADWVNTRSPYCYKNSAVDSFSELINSIKAKLILVSYSSDGIIPFEKMKEICLSKGYVSIVTSGYTTYRGGKQSNKRVNSDIEFVLVIDTSKKALPECEENIDKVLLEKKVLITLKRKFSKEKIELNFTETTDTTATIKFHNKEYVFPCVDKFELGIPKDFEKYEKKDLEKILSVLEKSVCETKIEELRQILNMCINGTENEKKYIRLIPTTLKKIAQKKYKTDYYNLLKEIEALKQKKSDLYKIIENKLTEVKNIAEIRFNT